MTLFIANLKLILDKLHQQGDISQISEKKYPLFSRSPLEETTQCQLLNNKTQLILIEV